MRLLHEMLWHLAEVARRSHDPVAADLETEIVGLTGASPDELLGVDLEELQSRVGAVLESADRKVRNGPSYRSRDLAGRDLREHAVYDADLRGSVLIGADLRHQDLGRADLLGADLRDADVRGADLREALFLSQSQVNGARGDGLTRIPERLGRPSHWS
jgi:uncharacterized protein YjbI with pentapeptide repeats